MEGKWVTSGIEQKLMDAQTAPILKEYTYKTKFQWNDENLIMQNGSKLGKGGDSVKVVTYQNKKTNV